MGGGYAKYYLVVMFLLISSAFNDALSQKAMKSRPTQKLSAGLRKPNAPKLVKLDRPKSIISIEEGIVYDWKCEFVESVDLCGEETPLIEPSDSDIPWFVKADVSEYNKIGTPLEAYTYRLGNTGIGSNIAPLRTLSLFGKDCAEGTNFGLFSTPGIRLQTQELNNNSTRHFWDIAHSNQRLGFLYDDCGGTPTVTFTPDGVGIRVDPKNNLDVKGRMAVGDSFTSVIAPTNGAIIEGKVGIGNSAPNSALQVNGGSVVGSHFSSFSAADGDGYFSKRLFVGTTDPVYPSVNFRVQDGSSLMRNNIEANAVFGGSRSTALQLQSGSDTRTRAAGMLIYTESNADQGSENIGVDIRSFSRLTPPAIVNDPSFTNITGIKYRGFGGNNLYGVDAIVNTENASCSGTVASIKGVSFGNGLRTFGVYAESNSKCCVDSSSNYGVYGLASTGRNNYSIFGENPQLITNSTIENPCTTNIRYAGFFNGDVYGASFQTPSDQRLKTNIKAMTGSLGIINNLELKSYEFRPSNRLSLSKGLQFGFMAQDLEKTLPQLVSESYIPDLLDTSGKVIAQGMNFKTVNYTPLIPVAIGGIQELNKELTAVKEELAALKAKINGDSNPVKGFNLGQNKPNPFSQSTEITYQLAGEFGAAFILLYSVDGKFSKTISLNPKENSVLVNSMDLPNGALYYSLVVDGSVKDTKIMIINH